MSRGPVREVTDKERLREIVKTMRDCQQDVVAAVVMEQFRYETGRLPTREQLREAME